MKKIEKDGQEIFTISDIDLKLLKDCLPDVEGEINRRIQWVIQHKCERIYKQFKEKWEKVLVAEGATSIPAQRDAFVALIVARSDYKNRAQREAVKGV